MKKSLLLIALPALMALSACGNAQRKANQDDFDYFKEDTVAHEEILGGGELAPQQLGVPEEEPGSDPDWTIMPKVGVQFTTYDKDVSETETPDIRTFYAVRYVAAVAFTSLDGITAEWTRGVSQKDSYQIKAMSGGHYSTELYASLNDGGSPKAATSEGGGYNNYIVYSMYDIPASQDESYIAAYLTISKAGQTTFSTRVVATQIDGSHYFSFDYETDLVKHGYFLQSDNFEVVVPQDVGADTDPGNEGKDNAKFSNVVLTAGDKFGLFRFTPTCFQFFGYSTFMSSTSASYIQSSTIDQYGQLYLGGTYTFFVNKYNQIYTQPNNVAVTFSLTPSTNWKDGGAVFYIYGFNSESDNKWYKLTDTDEDGVYTVSATDWSYSKLIYVRKNPSNDDGSWDGKWNQSGNIDVNFSSLSYVMSAGEWW